MDWLFAQMPIAGVEVFWPGLVVLGLGVGMIGSFIGMGGGWMVTPGLNILGFPMAFAIGTDITHMSGHSLTSTMRHSRLGNVDYKLGLIMTIGTVGGFESGAQLIMALERSGQIDLFVRLAYLILLALIAMVVLTDVRRARRRGSAPGQPATSSGIQWFKTLQRLRIPPVVEFRRAGIRCSAWLPIGVGFGTGWLAGVLGIGGGLIRMPALIYLIGCPTHVAVGTDLFEIFISALYGGATYTYKGRTDLVAAIIMVMGASVGSQIGSVATKYVKGVCIRLVLGVAVAGCAISITCKLAATMIPGARGFFDGAAALVILLLVTGLSIFIFWGFLKGVRAELSLKKAGNHMDLSTNQQESCRGLR